MMGDLSHRQRAAFGELKIVPRVCPLCGHDNASTEPSRYSLAPWTVKTCSVCGLTYIVAAPPYSELFENMSWENSSHVESEWRNSTRPVLQALSRTMRWRMRLLPRRTIPALLSRYAPAGNVVDLGCGDGGHMFGLPGRYVPYGIEISSASAGKANARFRLRGGYALNSTALDGLRRFPARHFTAATLRSYLEHELQPREVLEEVHRTLAPGGVAIVKVPNFGSLNRMIMGRRWCGFRHPDHLNLFTPTTLRVLASRTGFATWFGLTWRMPTSDNMWALLRKRLVSAWLCLVQSCGAGHVLTEITVAL